MRSNRILLLDTASLYFRAFYGVPDSLRAPDGLPVNAIRGLLDFITRLDETYSPTPGLDPATVAAIVSDPALAAMTDPATNEAGADIEMTEPSG